MGDYTMPLLNTSTRDKTIAQMRQFSDSFLTPADIERYMTGYGGAEDNYLNDAYGAIQKSVMDEYLPQLEAARLRGYSYGGLMDGAPARRALTGALEGAMSSMLTRKMSAGADAAARKAAFLREMYTRKAGMGADLLNQTYGKTLSAEKKPNAWQQVASGALQLGGSLLGAKVGAPKPMNTYYGQYNPAPYQPASINEMNDPSYGWMGGGTGRR